jgi:predicted RNase H-like HicB family nuclease
MATRPIEAGVLRLTLAAQREFHLLIEKGEEGYYVASVVELPGCHTQAKSLSELDRRTRDAIELYLEAEGKDLHIPEFIALKKIRV